MRRRVGGAGQGDVAEEVVIVAELPGLRLGALALRIERRRAGQHGVAPADENVGVMALGDMMPLVDTRRRLLEAEGRCVGLGARLFGRGERQRRDGGRNGGDGQRPAHQVAAAEAPGDDLAHAGIVARVAAEVL